MGNLQIRPGTQVSIARCPGDFETSTSNTCRYQCPSGYKYGQGISGELDRCIHETNNQYSATLQKIPVTSSSTAFDDERKRFNDEIRGLQQKIDADSQAQKNLKQQTDVYASSSLKRDALQSQYAGFSSVRDAAVTIKETSDSLKPMRSPTQPYSDIEKERRAILQITSQKLLIIQVALVTILLCAAEYVILPADYAHKLAFLTLSVGLAVGIFLTRKE